MSLLLDAVQRARHADAAKRDPALAPPLPTPVKRSLPWHWALPPLGLALGAAVAWWWPQPEVTTQSVVEVPYKLAGRVALPVPTELPASQSEPALQIARIDDEGVVQVASAEPETAALLPKQAVEDAPARQVGAPSESDTNALLAQQLAQAAAEFGLDEVAEVKAQTPGAEATVEEDNRLTEADMALLAAFEQAVADAGTNADNEPGDDAAEPITEPQQRRDIPKFGQLPWSFQKRVPDVVISAHVYATTPEDRWLRANGRELQEGDEAAPGLFVDEILPNEVVLELDGTKFRIPALGSI